MVIWEVDEAGSVDWCSVTWEVFLLDSVTGEAVTVSDVVSVTEAAELGSVIGPLMDSSCSRLENR